MIGAGGGVNKPANTVVPVITGTAKVSNTLTSSTGTWTGSPSYTYQWKRNGVAISLATNNTYLLVSADAGTTITVTVTATNAGGSVSATSLGTAIENIPVNSVAPVISGTVTTGSTLTSTTGTWSNNPTSYTYQWKRGGSNISSATNSTYVLVEADDGNDITCAVIGVNSAGNGVAATSNTLQMREFTNSSGQQGIVVFGDSITTRRSDAYGPTPSANTVYQWDVPNQQIVTIGATDILQSGAAANTGSPWPKYGIEYNTNTGYKPVIMTLGVGGTNYAPRIGETDNWSNSSTLYATQKTQVTNCLTAMGVSKPKRIIICLGINDSRGATALATVQTEITNFFTKLTTDFPSTTVLLVQIGREESGVSSARTVPIRQYLKQVCVDYPNVHLAANLAPFWAVGQVSGTPLYGGDDLHPSQAGNNEWARQVAQWELNSAYSKWARSIISCHFDVLSNARKTLIDTWITSLGSLYFDLDFVYNQHTTIESNTFIGLTFIWAGYKTSSTFTANDCITSNGTSSYFRGDWNPTNATKSSQNDVFFGVKIKTNRSGTGSTKVAFGVGSGGAQMALGQTNSPSQGIYYRVNDSTTSQYTTDTTFQANSFYWAYRSASGTKGLGKNGASVTTASVASATPANASAYQGALNNNGVAASFIDADMQYAVGGKFSTMNFTTLYNAMEALVSGW